MKSLEIEISKIQKLMGVTKINESHTSYKNQTLKKEKMCWIKAIAFMKAQQATKLIAIKYHLSNA